MSKGGNAGEPSQDKKVVAAMR